MKEIRDIVLMGVLIGLLAGCTTTNQAMQRLITRFRGKNMDEFVLQYGPPCSSYQLNNGEYIYTWNSGTISYQMPTTTTMGGVISPDGVYSGTATTSSGTLHVVCEIQIRTTKEGKIIGVRPVRDTWGKWTTSRCAEIFK